MDALRRDIEDLSDSITIITEQLYQQKAGAFESVGSLMDKLEAVTVQLFAQKSAGRLDSFDENKMMSVLADLMHAMEQHDTILMADLLEYDLKELLEASKGLK